MKTMYRALKASPLSHETQATELPLSDVAFSDAVQFEHHALYSDLGNQFLSVYLLDIDAQEAGPTGLQAKVVAVYRIDLELLAIGPVHHSIELKRQGTGCNASTSLYCAKLSLDIKFVQTQQIEIQLDSLKATVNK